MMGVTCSPDSDGMLQLGYFLLCGHMRIRSFSLLRLLRGETFAGGERVPLTTTHDHDSINVWTINENIAGCEEQ